MLSTPAARQRATFVVLTTSVMAFALLQSLVLPALSDIQTSLHTSQNTVTWVLTAYLLSASICTPIVGRFGDMWGKDRMFVVALSGLIAGALLAAVATSIGVLIAGRALQGIGGGVLPLSFGIIRDEFPKERVAGAVGVIAGLVAAGSGLGLVLAGPIVNALDYHWLFWLPAIVVIMTAFAAHFVIPASPTRAPGRVNWLAVGLMSSWLVALLVAVSEAPVWGWGSPAVLGLLAAAAVLAVAWILVESHSPNPLIDMTMMRIPVVWTSNLVALLFGVGLYSTFAFIPEFVQTPSSAGYGFGSSITQSGLIVLPMTAAMFVFSMISGRLTARIGAKALLVIGSALTIGNFGMLTVAHDHLWVILVSMAILGIGFGLAFSAMSTLVVQGVPSSQTGVASGMNANIRTIGGAIGAAVVSSIIVASAGPDGVPTASGYTRSFAVLTLAAVAATVAALLVPSVRKISAREQREAMMHAELGMVAAGTLAGAESE